VQRRKAGSADIRVINPMMLDGRKISVLEVLNDNMPFLFDTASPSRASKLRWSPTRSSPWSAMSKASSCVSSAKR
jgi:hypothetical protein